jgi:hypothetical protein
LGPCWRYSAIASCALVGRGRSNDFHTRERNKGKLAARRASKGALVVIRRKDTHEGGRGASMTLVGPS